MKKIRRENLGAKLHGGKNKINQRSNQSRYISSTSYDLIIRGIFLVYKPNRKKTHKTNHTIET
jgi:hypothetical protein